MREKLIQMLKEAMPSECKDYELEEGLTSEILSGLRCDKCKHWEERNYSGNPTRPGVCLYSIGSVFHRSTKRDFFCYDWESKN